MGGRQSIYAPFNYIPCASHVPRSQMVDAINSIISTYHPSSIVETGTNKGEGTTKMIADAIVSASIKSSIKSRFISIECNPELHRLACAYIEKQGLPVECRLGLSVSRSVLPTKAMISVWVLCIFIIAMRMKKILIGEK